MPGTRPRGEQGSGSSSSAGGSPPVAQPLDDWLGDVSDEDWSENASERGGHRRSTSVSEERRAPEGSRWREPAVDRPAHAEPVATAEAQRAVIGRRRLVAGLVFAVLVGLAVVAAVLLLRGDGEPNTTPSSETGITTTVPVETNPSTTPTPPAPSPPSPSTTTPSTSGDPAFTLPEGTKLQLGEEGDPAVIRDLQEALTAAGYEPGAADGTFGPQTEAAVTAFQEANGLSVDGRVGPETAAALNSALEEG